MLPAHFAIYLAGFFALAKLFLFMNNKQGFSELILQIHYSFT